MAKEKNIQSGSDIDTNAWMITFGDLIMLLLTFFVLLLTMKSMDSKALKKIFDRAVETSGPLEFQGATKGGSAIKGVEQASKSARTSKVELVAQVVDIINRMDRTLAGEDNKIELKDLIEVKSTSIGVSLTLSSDELFEPGKAEITPGKLPVVNSLGDFLQYTHNKILILSHTDNEPVKNGVFKSNIEFSFYRSLSIYYYFTDSLGLMPSKMAVGAYGDLRPRAPNNTPENRAKNRRIEIILKK